ncbi:MAG: T9SS type A sorting domain-containing protein [Saprospiraceae bacterium]|nr:T9SS type A sorting domain-containing protein [Saprospiraceae bacterium]
MYRLTIACAFIVGIFYNAKGQSCDINGKKHYDFQDVTLILDKNQCNSCHFKGSQQSNWSYQSYSSVFIETECNTPVINRGKPNESLLIDKLNGGPTLCGNAMPLGQNKINDADLLIIENWIEFGAPEYCIPVYEEVREILVSNKCQGCHSDHNSWSFDTYASIFIKPNSSDCSDPEIKEFSASESLLYKKIAGQTGNICGEVMLVDNNRMSESEITKIRDWINAGAPEFAKALPVTLTLFTTENIDNQEILLMWKTTSEVNTSHFIIEYSMDGIHYSALKSFPGAGSSGGTYTFVHENVNVGFNYYRLQIVDYDNSFNYSPIRVERINNNDEILRIYPIPAMNNETFTIEWYPIDGREKVRVNIMDITGKICQEYILNNGLNSYTFQHLKSGIYYISVEDYNFQRIVRKFVVLER